MFVPLLDTIGSLVAVILVLIELKKEKISIRFSGIKAAWKKLKDSFVYFASNMATTAFGALNTLLIGAFLPATEVAYWSVCMQLIGAVQTMYTPITEGVYPEMIKTKSWKFIKRLLMIFMPIVLAGSAGLADIGRTGQGRAGNKNNNSSRRCSGSKPAFIDCDWAFYCNVDRDIPLCNGVCAYDMPRMVLLEISKRVLLNMCLKKTAYERRMAVNRNYNCSC